MALDRFYCNTAAANAHVVGKPGKFYTLNNQIMHREFTDEKYQQTLVYMEMTSNINSVLNMVWYQWRLLMQCARVWH